MSKLTPLLIYLLLLVTPVWAQEAIPDWADKFRYLAVQQGGRVKPFDTFALESVRYITGKAQFEKRDPVLTVLQWWAAGPAVEELKVIEFRNQEWKKQLGLALERRHFSLKELHGLSKLEEVREQLHRLGPQEKVPAKLQPAQELLGKMSFLEMLSQGHAQSMIPDSKDPSATWGVLSSLPVAESLRLSIVKGSGQAEAVEQLAASVVGVAGYPSGESLAREVHYNHFHPFRKAWMLYLFSLVCLFLTVRGTQLYWIGVTSAGLGLALHSYGFYLRCLIGGRPPVTNMYESVIWVAFGAVAFALVFELIYKARSYLMAACSGALVCLLLADQLPAVLDPSIRPLMPVLRSNFWLTIHVLTITLGYAAFLLSFGLGHMVLWKYLSGPDQLEELGQLHSALYRSLQVGVLLLAAGTLLGGVWANYSWGRFWGWDPKEVWALIALLGYLAILHARYTGWAGNFGTAACSVLAFQGVVMAWYGVNFVLGVGLHSYGFGSGGVQYMAVVSLLDALFVGFVAWRVKGRRELV